MKKTLTIWRKTQAMAGLKLQILKPKVLMGVNKLWILMRMEMEVKCKLFQVDPRNNKQKTML